MVGRCNMNSSDVQKAMTYALANIKRLKKMSMMKYPLTDKRNNWVWYIYFTDADGVYYQNILGECVRRKKNKQIHAPQLFCFDFDYRRDAWFIDNIPELIDRIEDLFQDYYDKHVVPELKERGKIK